MQLRSKGLERARAGEQPPFDRLTFGDVRAHDLELVLVVGAAQVRKKRPRRFGARAEIRFVVRQARRGGRRGQPKDHACRIETVAEARTDPPELHHRSERLHQIARDEIRAVPELEQVRPAPDALRRIDLDPQPAVLALVQEQRERVTGRARDGRRNDGIRHRLRVGIDALEVEPEERPTLYPHHDLVAYGRLAASLHVHRDHVGLNRPLDPPPRSRSRQTQRQRHRRRRM
jgi:hypothetical protein